MIHHIIRPVRSICNTVAVQIKGSVVRPMIAASIGAPIQPAAADIFNLCAVADKGIAGDFVAFRSGGKMNTYIAALKQVSGQPVLVGVVDKHALVTNLFDPVSGHDA